ncbi:phage head-binding domain-containing protein [Symbiopectobacterium purcellii]|uniref:phage head-binding domain-containing protein n=1 Tax=Symbiopectobacterium purcellii TaxID=2871826 RepID=UPI00207688BB|nr:phage head-binding domain-containing protein [Symbiopectobacterium purcellii]
MADITPNVVVSMPSQLFTLARSFKANANGKIYIGQIDTDPTIPSNQIQVYLENEDGSHVPVAQPIVINAGGYPVYNGQIAKFVTVQGHSMAIYDAYNVQQFYFPNVLKYDPDQLRTALAQEDGAGLVNTPYGGSVLSVMSTSKYIRRGKFGLSGAVITSNSEAVLNQADGRYYAYREDISTPVAIPSLPNLDWICVGNGRMPNGTHTLFDFGCIDDNGITDNRANIQLAIDYMNYCGSVMYTDSTRDDKFFGVSSFHPSYPGVALASTSIRNTKIVGGRKRGTSIRWVGTDVGEALFSVEATAQDWGMAINGLGLNAGNKLNHVFKASKVHAAICEFNGGCYEEGVLDGIHLSAYNATFNNVYANSNGRDGFALGGPDSSGGWTSNVTTSVTFNACWSRANIRRGYFVANELWYSNFISTACDGISNRRTQLAYELANAKAVVMSGIGAEECQKVLKAYAFSLSVDGLQLSGVHADEVSGSIPVSDSFIEVSGFNINLSGLATLTLLDSYFTNDVKVNATGETKVTVLDSSFRDKRFNIVKASGISFFRYPEIVYFPSGCRSDSASDRTGNEIYAPASYAIRPSITKVAASIVRRTQAFSKITAGFTGLMTVIDGNDAFIVVDIVCHTDNNAEAFEKRVIAYKNANGWQKVEKGDTQSVFSVSVASGFIQIQTLVAGSISYIVDTRYSSTDGAIQFSF